MGENGNTNFGVSYMLDIYDCKPGVADDLEGQYRFLEQLVDDIGMTKASPPYVIHGPRKNGKELFPDKEGTSACIFLIESSIVIHGVEPRRFCTLDVFTCGKLDENIVLQKAAEFFGTTNIVPIKAIRGTEYGHLVPKNK